MKKLLIILAVLAVGCTNEYASTEELKEPIYYKCSSGHEYEVINIDGCEYLLRSFGSVAMMSHKGNCNNPKHYKK